MKTIDEIRDLTLPAISCEDDVSSNAIQDAYTNIIKNCFAPKDSDEAEKYMEIVDGVIEDCRNKFYATVLDPKKDSTKNIEESIRPLINWLSFFRFYIHYYSDHYIDYVRKTEDTLRAIKGFLADFSFIPLAEFFFQVNTEQGNFVCVRGAMSSLLEMYVRAIDAFFTFRGYEKNKDNINAFMWKLELLANIHAEKNDFLEQDFLILDPATYLKDNNESKYAEFINLKEKFTLFLQSSCQTFKPLLELYLYLEQKVSVEHIDRLNMENKTSIPMVYVTMAGGSIMVSTDQDVETQDILANIMYILHQKGSFGETTLGLSYEVIRSAVMKYMSGK